MTHILLALIYLLELDPRTKEVTYCFSIIANLYYIFMFIFACIQKSKYKYNYNLLEIDNVVEFFVIIEIVTFTTS
jgi:hypothetical protein